jgi:hypothetical protein
MVSSHDHPPVTFKNRSISPSACNSAR